MYTVGVSYSIFAFQCFCLFTYFFLFFSTFSDRFRSVFFCLFLLPKIEKRMAFRFGWAIFRSVCRWEVWNSIRMPRFSLIATKMFLMYIYLARNYSASAKRPILHLPSKNAVLMILLMCPMHMGHRSYMLQSMQEIWFLCSIFLAVSDFSVPFNAQYTIWCFFLHRSYFISTELRRHSLQCVYSFQAAFFSSLLWMNITHELDVTCVCMRC